MRTVLLLLIAGGAAVLFSRCTTNRFYAPNTMQVPMLAQQQEATISGSYSKTRKLSGFDVQGMYSPLPHVGLMASHFDIRYNGSVYTEFSPFFYESQYNGRSRLTEGGTGAYTQVGPNKEYLLSLFGGFGQGNTLNRYSPPPDMQTTETFDSRWKYRRWFVQPALGMKYRRLQVGTALRFVWLDYYEGDINSRMGILETERIQALESNSPLFLTEMAWTIGLRLRPLVLSLNSTAVVRGKDAVRDLELASNYVSFSVGLNLHELVKEKEQKPGKKKKKKQRRK